MFFVSFVVEGFLTTKNTKNCKNSRSPRGDRAELTKKLVGAKSYAEFKSAFDSLLNPTPAVTN